LNQAKDYLINTNTSIGEIVYLTGFKDHSNFVRYFKSHENTTPENYRKYYKT